VRELPARQPGASFPVTDGGLLSEAAERIFADAVSTPPLNFFGSASRAGVDRGSRNSWRGISGVAGFPPGNIRGGSAGLRSAGRGLGPTSALRNLRANRSANSRQTGCAGARSPPPGSRNPVQPRAARSCPYRTSHMSRCVPSSCGAPKVRRSSSRDKSRVTFE